jgi:hypothetical protein
VTPDTVPCGPRCAALSVIVLSWPAGKALSGRARSGFNRLYHENFADSLVI